MSNITRRPTLTLVLEESFDSGVKTIRRALEEDQLCITAELDAAFRIRRSLDIAVSPCRILLVETPLAMLEATAIDRSSAVFIPLHVVVSANGRRTLVHLSNLRNCQAGDFPLGIRMPLMRLHVQVLCCLARIATNPRDADAPADRGDDRRIGLDGRDAA